MVRFPGNYHPDMSDNDTEQEPLELPVEPGDLIGGKYRVDRVLAVGGMGAVLEATHKTLRKRVAIKLMLPELTGHKEAVKRFLHEAHAAASLDSDFIAGVSDVDTLDDGTPYMVMDFIEGESLADLLDDGPLPIERAVDICMQVCLGLQVAHTHGVVHRDIKPSNLMLTTTSSGEARAVILDFGIAKIDNPFGSSASLTNTRAMLGSPAYMSPEQVGNAKNVDRRTDIWSLGVVLWQMLTGESLFGAETVAEVLAAILRDDPGPPSALRARVPPELDEVVLRCLERQRGDRYGTAHELLHALAPFATQRARLSLVRLSDRPPPLSTAGSGVEASPSTSLAVDGSVSASASTQMEGEAPPASGADPLAAAGGLTTTNPNRRLLVGVLAGAIVVAGVGFWLNASSPTAAGPGGGTTSAPEAAAPAAQPASAAVSPKGHESAKPAASRAESPPASSPPPSQSAQGVAVTAPGPVRTASPAPPPPPPSAPTTTSTYNPFDAPPGALDKRQ